MFAVLSYGVGGVLDRLESVRMLVHECQDALDTFRLDLRRDVDQDQRPAEVRHPVADDESRRPSAEGRTHKHRLAAERCQNRIDIGGEVFRLVIAFLRPAAVAVPS